MLSEERQITDCETCQNSDASDILTQRFHVDLSNVFVRLMTREKRVQNML